MEVKTEQRYELYASCGYGLEKLVASELEALGIHQIRPLSSGVTFYATPEEACRALLWLRCASRVLLVLGRVDATDADTLYNGCYEIAWPKHVAEGATIAVHAKGTNDNLRNSVFTALKVKDAMCDALRTRAGRRPDVNLNDPDVAIRVSLRNDRATIYLDLSGEPLHIRGYRERGVQVQAPIKETIAAAILLSGGWKELCESGDVAFVDPLCGSGTLAIEAAMIAGDIAPGIQRAKWGIQGWRLFKEEMLDELIAEADDRLEAGMDSIPPIFASDIDKDAISYARLCAKRAGLAEKITFKQADIASLEIEGLPEKGLVACNPPYGERMMSREQLISLEIALKRFIATYASGFNTSIICTDSSIDAVFGSQPESVISTKNGPIDATIRAFAPLNPDGGLDEEQLAGIHADAEQFANRLAKMAKHRGKWARKQGITCYRVYDADLPEFNMAIDIYQGMGNESRLKWIHVSEYAAPKTVDSELAAQRVTMAIDVIQREFGVGAGDVFLKRRERSKGGSQYSSPEQPDEELRFTSRNGYRKVEEGGHTFKVKFDGGLDTGLFLDTRSVRKMIEEQSNGKSFLNLFAYTGSATVYAAAGGAKSTYTVDLSQRYLDWAKENMRINKFNSARHVFERADAVEWIANMRKTRNRFDLIYLDPPTFSNSKRMKAKSFDIQRDHAELLIGASRLLTKGGKAIFCCNLRDFKPDVEALEKAKVKIEDITAQTIPEDFERNQKIHHCYIVTRVWEPREDGDGQRRGGQHRNGGKPYERRDGGKSGDFRKKAGDSRNGKPYSSRNRQDGGGGKPFASRNRQSGNDGKPYASRNRQDGNGKPRHNRNDGKNPPHPMQKA